VHLSCGSCARHRVYKRLQMLYDVHARATIVYPVFIMRAAMRTIVWSCCDGTRSLPRKCACGPSSSSLSVRGAGALLRPIIP
jgi:hypothetical protein